MREDGHGVIATDLGPWEIRWTERGLSGFRPMEAPPALPPEAPGWVREAAARLARHLDGEPQDLADLPLDLSGLTPFQRAVAEALRRTRAGQLTYGDLAALAGRPGAARAVGRALRDNPMLVLIPCHRVVAASSEGGWSAFGSPEVKRRLRALDEGDMDQRA
ncbi:MAG TPA: methylated-DNA--[protein]-cysteine S-methyltransferase [Holophagaceae bacterium]|nr:methylated-DNA--[protein]-cysteine S-methyltransferase [Holophagaceae bacterium]